MSPVAFINAGSETQYMIVIIIAVPLTWIVISKLLKRATRNLESQAQDTSLFTRAASNQRGCPKQRRQSGLKSGGSWIRVTKFRFSRKISEKFRFIQAILQTNKIDFSG